MDKRVKYYSFNTNLLPPKQGIQEFHRKYVLVPADKAPNYINTLKEELYGTKAFRY